MNKLFFILLLTLLLLSCSSDDSSNSTTTPPPTSEFITCGDTQISPTTICITTPASFLAITGTGKIENYVLGADLDFTGITYKPPGIAGGDAFTGNLDGNGHIISNITHISQLGNDDCGAIFCASTYIIKNLGIKNVNFTAKTGQYSAGLVGHCSGCFISNVYVDGVNISVGSKSSGGLVGEMNNGAIIENSYVANVIFTDPNTYDPSIGVIAGDIISISPELKNIYYQNDTTLNDKPMGTGTAKPGSTYTGKSLAQMQCATRSDCNLVFDAFDFDSVWASTAGQNSDLPYLR